MKWALLAALVFLLAMPAAYSLESGTIFSVKTGEGYKCVYISLPQDLGLSELNETAETLIETNKDESPWTDMTYSRVVMEPGTLNKDPVCFRYSEKEDGDFSFYNIRMSSRELGISNSISGGLCVSKYEDVDVIENANSTDVCTLLSEYADIIDLGFNEDVTQAKPGEVVEKTLYVTSYANLRIKLSAATNLQNDFGESAVATSPSKPLVRKTFKIKAPEREGKYELTVMAQAEGCAIQACKKQKKTFLSVNAGEKKGFSVAVNPGNINLKEPAEVLFRVIISNYDNPQDFTITANTDPPAATEPQSTTVSVGKNEEKTSVFNVTPGNAELYKTEFTVSTNSTEKLMTSYISIGEILTDALRYSEDAESNSAPDLKGEIQKATDDFENKYNSTNYGDDIKDYEDFRKTVDDLKNSTGNSVPDNTGKGFNWMFVAIPVVIIVAVILLLFAFRKAKSPEQYEGYGGYQPPRERELIRRTNNSDGKRR